MEDTILDREGVHARLLQDLQGVAATAGVPVFMLHTSMAEYCTKEEVEWIKRIHFHRQKQVAGLILTGAQQTPPETKLMAMAAALLRNYIDARVVSLVRLLQQHETGEGDHPTVLLVPNFCLHMEGGKPLANWQVQVLYDLLMGRMVGGKPTLLYVHDLEHARKAYGEAMVGFLNAHWTVL